MNAEIQLSRAQQLWLMLALLASCGPVWFFLPWWVAALGLLGIGWRMLLLFRGVVRPNRLVMTGLAVVLLIGVLLTYMPPIGVEPMSAILTASAGLKYLELERRGQSMLLIYLCYFILGIQLIFSQTIPTFGITMLACLVVLAAQHVMQQDARQHYAWRTLSWQPVKLSASLILVSVPLALVIFLVAPRIPSFWVVPIQQAGSQTGVSDRMDPGAVASLGQSSEIAFRVDFENEEIPARSQLYWRGLVMSDFDGRTWAVTDERRFQRDGEPIIWPDRRPAVSWQEQIERRGNFWTYDVYMEPSYQRYLFSLAAPRSEQNLVGLARDMTLVYQQPVTQQIRYQVNSALNYRLQPQRLDDEQLARNLYVPPEANPRTRALVESWRNEGLEVDQMLNRLFAMFGRDFVYTFEPPVYPGRDSLDDFLFEGQAGFCEHFASATAMILRAAGVPARIVGGYQGGELNPFENYLIVRQYDAHAWVEYWQEGRGWVQIDPTVAVARGRIDQGFEDYFADARAGAAGAFSLDNLRNLPLMNWVRLQIDSLNYYWVRWVVSYDSGIQFDIFSRLLGGYSPTRIAAFLGGCFALLMLAWWLAGLLLQRSAPLSTQARLVRRFRNRMEKAGIEVGRGRTLRQITADAELQFPAEAQVLRDLGRELEALYYAGEGDVTGIKDRLNQLRLKNA